MNSALFQMNPSFAVKFLLTFSMFSNTISSMGTARHYHFVEAIDEGSVSVWTVCNLLEQAHRMVGLSMVLV